MLANRRGLASGHRHHRLVEQPQALVEDIRATFRPLRD
jgi:hypothetical protein